ncbi:MAG: hypothetical protein VB036_03400, partial [Propionicimonas sp.]|nr:hypothetical protein [Propionicimonas sp.]
MNVERLLARVRHSDELRDDEEWDCRPEFERVEQLLREEVRHRREYEDWTEDWTPEQGLDGADDEEALMARLLLAAQGGDADLVEELAGRLNWSRARWRASGQITQDGPAIARVIVSLNAWRPVLAVLRARLGGLPAAELESADDADRGVGRAEDAALTMVHLAMALLRSGCRDQADEIVAALPDSSWLEGYCTRAAIDAAGAGDGELAVRYLSRIATPRGLAE